MHRFSTIPHHVHLFHDLANIATHPYGHNTAKSAFGNPFVWFLFIIFKLFRAHIPLFPASFHEHRDVLISICIIYIHCEIAFRHTLQCSVVSPVVHNSPVPGSNPCDCSPISLSFSCIFFSGQFLCKHIHAFLPLLYIAYSATATCSTHSTSSSICPSSNHPHPLMHPSRASPPSRGGAWLTMIDESRHDDG